MLFGVLMTLRLAFTMGVDMAGADRLMLIHKVSLIQPLPVSYSGAARDSARASSSVTHNSWFGGIYQDPHERLREFAVEPEPYLADVPGVQAAARIR